MYQEIKKLFKNNKKIKSVSVLVKVGGVEGAFRLRQVTRKGEVTYNYFDVCDDIKRLSGQASACYLRGSKSLQTTLKRMKEYDENHGNEILIVRTPN